MKRLNAFSLHCAGLIPGDTYHVVATTNFLQWTDLGAVQAAPDGSLSLTDTNTLSTRYYRLESQ